MRRSGGGSSSPAAAPSTPTRATASTIWFLMRGAVAKGDKGSYEVGFSKPPRSTQFKPGQSEASGDLKAIPLLLNETRLREGNHADAGPDQVFDTSEDRNVLDSIESPAADRGRTQRVARPFLGRGGRRFGCRSGGMTGQMSGNEGIFAEWQPRYAQHGVATFPVQIIG